jgi:hypothetical protein
MYVTAATPPPRRHESWAIAQVLPRPEGAEIDEVLNQVHDHIQENLHLEVVNFAESAVGLGLYRMRDSAVRDLLVNQPAHQLENGRTVTFVRHDEGENFRSTVYTRLSWLMMLNLPMDYRNEEFLRDSVAKFGKMRGWIREDPTPARTLIRVAYGGTRDVPRSLVIREPQRYGGTVVSWTVPIYILTSEPEDVLPPDESPEPENGNPHPQFFVGPVPPQDNWAPPMNQGWDNWNEEGHAGNDNDNVNPGWDLPGPDFMQQLPSSISVQFTDHTISSVQLVPGEGPVLVQQRNMELIEIEDITEDWEEEYPQNVPMHDV